MTTYTYVVSDVYAGDAGMAIESFKTKDEAIAYYHQLVSEHPDRTFDIGVEDEDGDWIDVFQPDTEEST